MDYTGRIRRAAYEVRPVPHGDALGLVRAHHYAGNASKTGSYDHGLFDRATGNLVGAAMWLPPVLQAAKSVWPRDPHRVLALSRLVVVPGVPKNAAGFLMARSIRLIRRAGRYDCLVTYADTWRGHDGTVYRATNWRDDGLTAPRPVWLDAHGRVVSYKMAGVNRNTRQMRDLGHTLVGKFPKRRYVMALAKQQEE